MLKCPMSMKQSISIGVGLSAGRSFKCSFDHVKLKFYGCFNAIYSRAKDADSEMVCVQLLKSFCLPIILYVTEATKPIANPLLID